MSNRRKRSGKRNGYFEEKERYPFATVIKGLPELLWSEGLQKNEALS